jgi:hypothetical protein
MLVHGQVSFADLTVCFAQAGRLPGRESARKFHKAATLQIHGLAPSHIHAWFGKSCCG